MAAKQAANREPRWLNQERAREIEQRRWRNHMRFMLFLFKGKPSTSRACPWVNDPDEPEAITADWKPPPQPPGYDEPDPPF